MAWEINEYIGAGGLKFGMSPTDTIPILGIAQTVLPGSPNAERHLFGREKPILIFDEKKLVEINFAPEADEPVLYNQVDLLKTSEQQVLEALWQASGKADTFELMGFVVFFPLGIALSGYHDGDSNQKAVSCFVSGRWDRFRSKMKKIGF